MSPLAQRVTEVEEFVGYHLEQSVQTAASTLLKRSSSLLSLDDPNRPQILLDEAFALTERGAFLQAEQAISEAETSVWVQESDHLAALVDLERWRLRIVADPPEAMKAAAMSDRLIDVLERHGDDAALAQVWLRLTESRMIEQTTSMAEEAAERAIEYARRVGDRRAELDACLWVAVATLDGPLPAAECFARFGRLEEQAGEDRFLKGVVLVQRSVLEAMQGRFEDGRRTYRRGRALQNDVGRAVQASASAYFGFRVEMLAGDPAGAERLIRPDYEALLQLGERAFLSTHAAALAQALCAQGRYEEADPLIEISREAGAAEDALTQIEWRRAQAPILARRGNLEGAEALLRETLRILEPIDLVDYRANALMELASILAARGHLNESRQAIAKALVLFESKGNLVSAAKARTRIVS